MSCNLIDVYLCNFMDRDCNRSPGCCMQGGPCHCTTDKKFAQLQNDGKPIVIDRVPAYDAQMDEEGDE